MGSEQCSQDFRKGMKHYVALIPDKVREEQLKELGVIKLYTKNGKIVKTYTDVHKAIMHSKRYGSTIVASSIKLVGSAPLDIFSVIGLIGIEHLICCDIPYLDEHSVAFAFVFYERKKVNDGKRMSVMIKERKARGEKIGNAQNFTSEGRSKGAMVNKKKVLDSPKMQQALSEMNRLRELGVPLQSIAKQLNQQGMRTAQGKMWAANSVHRFLTRSYSAL